jgi:hypothetical protein
MIADFRIRIPHMSFHFIHFGHIDHPAIHLAFRSSSRFPRLNRDRKFFQTIRDSGSTWRNRSFAECGIHHRPIASSIDW